MMKCKMRLTKGDLIRRLDFDLDDDTLIEGMWKEPPRGKPRTVQYPRSVMGSSSLRFVGAKILERMGQGYNVVEESDELSKDRIQVNLAIRAETIDVLVAALGITGGVAATGHHVLSDGLLVWLYHDPDRVRMDRIDLTFLASALDCHLATRIATAVRCAIPDLTASADFTGERVDLAALVKPLRDFNSLGDYMLDKFASAGVRLRSVDLRTLSPALSGYVGV